MIKFTTDRYTLVIICRVIILIILIFQRSYEWRLLRTIVKSRGVMILNYQNNRLFFDYTLNYAHR